MQTVSVSTDLTERTALGTFEIECHYTDPPHTHSFPEDWVFGGASGLHPAADPRWTPTTYEYYDGALHVVETTQVPLCDDQAIDEFTKVANYGPGYKPVYLSKRQPGERPHMLPWVYDKETDTVYPR